MAGETTPQRRHSSVVSSVIELVQRTPNIATAPHLKKLSALRQVHDSNLSSTIGIRRKNERKTNLALVDQENLPPVNEEPITEDDNALHPHDRSMTPKTGRDRARQLSDDSTESGPSSTTRCASVRPCRRSATWMNMESASYTLQFYIFRQVPFNVSG